MFGMTDWQFLLVGVGSLIILAMIVAMMDPRGRRN